MSIGYFLGGIAAVIWDPKYGRYLLLRRSPRKDFGAGEWECVTGRVEQGESYTQALHREVQEEIGAEVRIDFLLGVTHFYRGAHLPENELLGAVFGCSLRSAGSITHGAEHSELRWVTLQEAETLLPEGHWLRSVLRRVELLRRQVPEAVRSDFQTYGFEI